MTSRRILGTSMVHVLLLPGSADLKRNINYLTVLLVPGQGLPRGTGRCLLILQLRKLRYKKGVWLDLAGSRVAPLPSSPLFPSHHSPYDWE